jgi:hypothetical protein
MIRPSLALAAIAAFGLSACGSEQPQNYETDVVDKSGGELIVVDEDPDAVDVTLPETPMTNAPAAPEAPAE